MFITVITAGYYFKYLKDYYYTIESLYYCDVQNHVIWKTSDTKLEY